MSTFFDDEEMEHFRPMHPCLYCGDDCDCLDGQDDKDRCEGCPECREEEKGAQDDDEGAQDDDNA